MLDPIRDFPWLRHGYEQGIKKGKRQGKLEGKLEGRAEGLAEAIFTVLAGRGIAVDDLLRQRILRCSDQDLLRSYLARAVTATTTAEVIGES